MFMSTTFHVLSAAQYSQTVQKTKSHASGSAAPPLLAMFVRLAPAEINSNEVLTRICRLKVALLRHIY